MSIRLIGLHKNSLWDFKFALDDIFKAENLETSVTMSLVADALVNGAEVAGLD